MPSNAFYHCKPNPTLIPICFSLKHGSKRKGGHPVLYDTCMASLAGWADERRRFTYHCMYIEEKGQGCHWVLCQVRPGTCVCVFSHDIPIFLPVDILPREIQALVWLQNHDAEILRSLQCIKQSRQCNDLPLYWIRQVRHTYKCMIRYQTEPYPLPGSTTGIIVLR